MPRAIFPLLALLSLSAACKNDAKVTPVDDGSEEEVFENDFGQWLSMDVTPDGQPAIAYYDATKGALGFAVGELSEGAVTWSHHKVDGYAGDDGLDPGDLGKYASMAIADDGTVWIAYYNASAGGLYYARCKDGVWETGLADAGGGASPDAGRWASIALSASGDPLIAHYDAGKQELRASRWNGSSFTSETVDAGEDYEPVDTGDSFVEADVGRYARVLIDGDTEYIAYYDAALGDLKLATSSGGGWSISVVDGQDGDVGAWPSMVAQAGTLWIAYHDVGNQDLKIASGSPGSWSIETVDSGEHVGADSELILVNGSPEVIYFDGQDSDMKWSRLGSGGWEPPSTVAGADGALGFHNEIITIGDTRYVACYDYTNRTLWFSAL